VAFIRGEYSHCIFVFIILETPIPKNKVNAIDEVLFNQDIEIIEQLLPHLDHFLQQIMNDEIPNWRHSVLVGKKTVTDENGKAILPHVLSSGPQCSNFETGDFREDFRDEVEKSIRKLYPNRSLDYISKCIIPTVIRILVIGLLISI